MFPYSNYGKGTTSFGDSALYLVALYTPLRISQDVGAKGGSDNLLDIESQVTDNTFMPLSLPSQEPGRKGITNYEVKLGDTVGSIASQFNLNATTVLWANGLSAGSRLKPGQNLKILPVDGIMYTVKKGDTLGSISLTYKVYTETIIDVNNLSSQGFIMIGQDLIIPGGVPLPPRPKPLLGNGSVAPSGEQILADVRGALVNPAPGGHLSQGLHYRNAVDLANSCGAPIVAAATGTVIKADTEGWNGGFGKYVMMSHPSGFITVYGHMSQVLVLAGQSVSQGSRIGLIGQTGHATGCHVHFEVRGGINPFVQ